MPSVIVKSRLGGNPAANGIYTEVAGSDPKTFLASTGYSLFWDSVDGQWEMWLPGLVEPRLAESAADGDISSPATATWVAYSVQVVSSPGQLPASSGGGGVVSSPGSVAPGAVGAPSAPGEVNPVSPGVPDKPDNYVGTFAQALTEEQKAQARENIGTAEVFTSPAFLSDPSLVANKATTTAVIQAMLDTGKSVRLPDRRYVLDPLLVKYKGTVIQGESIGGVWLDFSTIPENGRAISVVEDPGDLTTRMPGAATTGNNYLTLENLFMTGPNKEVPGTTPWQTGTSYSAGDRVTEAFFTYTVAGDEKEVLRSYICLTDHTSGTFDTDLSAERWESYESIGIRVMPANEATIPEVGWQGDASTFRNVWVQQFGVGIQWNNPNKHYLVNCLSKGCNIGLETSLAGTATNNVSRVEHYHSTECNVGLLNGGGDIFVTWGDTSATKIVLLCNGGYVKSIGGQIEGSEIFISANAAKVSVEQVSMLSSNGSIPFVLANRAAMEINNVTVFFNGPSWETGTPYVVGNVVEQASLTYICLTDHTSGAFSTDVSGGNWERYDTPLAKLTESNCTVWGQADYTMLTFSNYAGRKYQVELWNGQYVFLCPFPVRDGTVNPASYDDDGRGHIWYAVDSANDQGDDIRVLHKTGISTLDGNDQYAKMSLTRVNNLTCTQQGTFQDITGIENYHLCEGSATGSRTVRLPRISFTGARLNNSHVVTIVDRDGNAGTNNITIAMHSTDSGASEVFYGSTSIAENFGSATFMTQGVGTGWRRIK